MILRRGVRFINVYLRKELSSYSVFVDMVGVTSAFAKEYNRNNMKHGNGFYFFLYALSLIRIILDLIAGIIFKRYYKNKSVSLPPITDAILLESATSLAEKIRNQKVNYILWCFALRNHSLILSSKNVRGPLFGTATDQKLLHITH